MELYLVQHGEAYPKEEDPERSLTTEGAENTRLIADFLSAYKEVKVEYIYHSGKKRAKQTAEILGNRLNPSHEIEATGQIDPKDDPGFMAKKLASLNAPVLVVGHLPHLSKLAAFLITGDPEKEIIRFKNAGAVCLTQDDHGKWLVKWMILPEMLREGKSITKEKS